MVTSDVSWEALRSVDKENEQERLSSTSLDIQAGNKHCTS